MEDFDEIHQLEASDIFTQFVLNPCAFRDFVVQHFDRAYSSLFVDQIQPLDPKFTCCVHATTAINGNENGSTVTMLKIIAEKLPETPFSLLGCAFDGDSCFDSLHDDFQNAWEKQLSSGRLSSFFGRHMVIPPVIGDPLHLLKRIRYGSLSADFRMGVNGDER
jgi:hypothetical protein